MKHDLVLVVNWAFMLENPPTVNHQSSLHDSNP